MKTLFKSSLIAIALVAALSVPIASQGQTTTTNSISPSFGDAMKVLGQAIENSTNWNALTGYGHSISGTGKNLAFIDLAYNISDNVGFVVGYDYLSANHQVGTFNAVKGGVNLQTTIHPFAFLGSTVLTNILVQPFVADLLATPQDSGNIGNIVTTGVNWDFFSFKNFALGAGVQYENRTGQDNWDGNYILGHIALSRKF